MMDCYRTNTKKDSWNRYIYIERNMFVVEKFISSLIKIYGKHPIVSTEGETWYPQACRFLKLKHHLHPRLRKALLKGLCNT